VCRCCRSGRVISVWPSAVSLTKRLSMEIITNGIDSLSFYSGTQTSLQYVCSHCDAILSELLCRTCLRYFLPPQWVMDKDSVSGLSLDDLASFPLEDFFDHYEKGLKKVNKCWICL
jgi:hypothetical protein